MSDNNPKQTRKDLYKNNKRNNLYVILAVVAGAMLSLFLLYQFFYGSGEDEPSSLATNGQTNQQSVIITEPNEESSESSAVSDSSKVKDSEEEDKDKNKDEDKKTETSEGLANGAWEPIGTTQTGDHVTNYEDGSADRTEINQATAAATGINASEMIEWWVGNGGDQQVTATVSDKAKSKMARVLLQWIDGEGWQVTQVEELTEIP